MPVNIGNKTAILAIKLSICLSTYNRADFIAQTLDTLVSQLRKGVELLVVDGASTDDTLDVMSAYCEKEPRVRYYREAENSGVDADYDKAVSYARGQYCWLMTDDDLVVPGAIDRILAILDEDVDLLLVNAAVDNKDFSKVLQQRKFQIDEDRRYGSMENEAFFRDAADLLTFIGCVVIRRVLWLQRDRQSYYGSLFVHVGVIFQAPIDSIHVIADPLVRIRYGNAMWTSRGFEIWMFKWPQLIWSFDRFPESARQAITEREPYRSIKRLIWSRAIGSYSMTEYKRYLGGARMPSSLAIAMIPAVWLNAFSSLYCYLLGNNRVAGLYELLRAKSSNWMTRRIAAALGI
jgi:abequosyltransferase